MTFRQLLSLFIINVFKTLPFNKFNYELRNEVRNEIRQVSYKDIDGFTAILDREIPNLLEEHNLPGLSVSLVHDGKVVWSEGFGFSNVQDREAVQRDTIFQAASISKSITALGVMKLVESGMVDLDAPVETYLTRWNIPDSEYDKNAVTVQSLLNHTSGLSVSGYAGFHPDDTLPTIEESLNGNLGTISFLDSLYDRWDPARKNVHLIQKPGDGMLYSGGGYTVLQLLIEEVTGKSFSSFMKTEVLDPIGMTNSSFDWDVEMRDRTATAYAPGYLFQTASPNYLYTAKAAAGLYSTSYDLALFVGSFMEGAENSITSPETSKIIFDSELGIWAAKLSDGSVILSHKGLNAGDWCSFYKIAPKYSTGITIMTNGTRGGDVRLIVADMWEEWLLSSFGIHLDEEK